jgi:hypothetical protein
MTISLDQTGELEPDPGEATIYYAMPTSSNEANADSVSEWATTIAGAAFALAKLEALGWKPRWCDNSGDNEFTEIAYEKEFTNQELAEAEVERLNLGVNLVWDGIPV